MNCPNCGTDVPSDTIMCPVCGGPVAARPQAGYGQPTPAAPSYVEPTPFQTKKSSPVPAIIITVAALVLIFVSWWFFLGGKYMGTYKLTEVTASGMVDGELMTETVAASELASVGLDDMALKVNFNNRCSFLNASQYGLGGPYKFKVSGGEVSITDADNYTVHGTYKKGTITLEIEEYGVSVSFVFKK